MDRNLDQSFGMLSPTALETLRNELADAVATLHLVSDAAERRGDDDTRRAVRMVARVLEGVEERLDEERPQ